MRNQEWDVVVIGAGAAGLAAALRLSTAGRKVLVLEARNRIGGRILTLNVAGHWVELGAEFIHGRAPEIFDLVKRFGLKTHEVEGDQFCKVNDRLSKCDFFDEVYKVLDGLKKYQGTDISFEQFVRSVCEDEITRDWARRYVAGFHGALPDDAGVQAIIEDTKAEEEIDGERSWRIVGGYRQLIDCIWRECENNGVQLRLDTRVELVEWGGGVRIVAKGFEFTASAAVVTLPVSLLQRGSVEFQPELRQKREALQAIAMGHVARCVLTFRSSWWRELKSDHGQSLGNLSFLFSREDDFPTWWTQSRSETPVLTAWASAFTVPELTGKTKEEIEVRAVGALAAITGSGESAIRNELVSIDWHDWIADPLTNGAYTYTRVGGTGAYKELAAPLGGALFFAGEATEWTGNHATVHGAIASGYRAADEVLSQL